MTVNIFKIFLHLIPELNYQLQHSSSSSIIHPMHGGHMLQQSKSSASIPLHQQMQHLNNVAAANRYCIPIIDPATGLEITGQFQRGIMVSNPVHTRTMGLGMSSHPLVNSPSTGNLFQVQFTKPFSNSRHWVSIFILAPEPSSQVRSRTSNSAIVHAEFQ